MQKLVSQMVRAIKKYNLISEGDKIAIGLSGGKDSLLMLKLLSLYKKYADMHFEIIALCVNAGFGATNFEGIKNFCAECGVEIEIINSEINDIVFNIRKEKNPCSLCAKMRRGLLCSRASELGCNKLALAHHKDDLTETLFLSLLYEGRFSTFAPKSYMSNTKITTIRPMILFSETEIINATKNFPILKNPCPKDKKTKREEIKSLLLQINKQIPIAKQNIENAIINPSRNNLWKDSDFN